MAPDEMSGLGGATEGDVRGFVSDLVDSSSGVSNLAGGHLSVVESSPAAMSVLINQGVGYIPNADYDQYDSDAIKFWEAVVDADQTLTIDANSSGSTRIDLVCLKLDTGITPNEYASNIATLLIVKGTPGAGAPTLPDNHLLLAEVTVVNGETSITNSEISDERTQALIASRFLPADTPILTTKGDLLSFSTVLARLPIGTNNQVLTADSGETLGMKWADPTGGVPVDLWIEDTATWTRTGDDTYTISGDVTAKYRPGTKVRFRDGGSDEFGVVGSSTYGAPNTTVNLIPNDTYAMAAATITNKYYSYGTPPDFPVYFAFTPTFTGFSSQPTNFFCQWYTIGRRMFFDIRMGSTGTSNATTFGLALPVTPGGLTSCSYRTTAAAFDNSVALTGASLVIVAPGDINLAIFKDFSGGSSAWTASGGKLATFSINFMF